VSWHNGMRTPPLATRDRTAVRPTPKTAQVPTISAVLPAYNEAAVIADVVRDTAAALRASGTSRFEILVVDDGSADATAARASEGGHADDVRVLSHGGNRGYGAALRTGFEAAACDAVWLMDSDGQFDPGDLSLLLPLYGRDRVVAGYRVERSDAAVRRLNNAAFFSVVRMLFGSTVRDVNCAFKLFPAAVGRGLWSSGAVISTELLLRARNSGYDLVEVGVSHYPRRAGQATGADPRVVARAFSELWELRRDPARLNSLARP